MRILLAVNETNNEVDASQYLAKRFGRQQLDIDILSIIPRPELFRSKTGNDKSTLLALEKQDRLYDKACSLVAGFEKEINESVKARKIRTHVEYGDPAEVLLNCSRQLGSDMILIGTPSRNRILTAFRVDGVTRRILKWSECPVEIFRTANSETVPNRVVVPVRISSTGEVALPDLAGLPWNHGTHLHLFGALPPVIDSDMLEVNQASLLLRMQDYKCSWGLAKSRLATACEKLAHALPDHVKVSHELVEGKLPEVLPRQVDSLAPSLVVLDDGWSGGARGNLFSNLAPMALVMSMPCSVICLTQKAQDSHSVQFAESTGFAR